MRYSSRKKWQKWSWPTCWGSRKVRSFFSFQVFGFSNFGIRILITLMKLPFDIVGLGCAAVDDLLYVPAFPAIDTKVQIRRRERQGGGLTATALVAAARLGSRCAYAGVLGVEDLSQFIRRNFEQEGVDVSWIRQRSDARPIHSIIIVDESTQSRTIFYDLENVYGAEPGWPEESVIRSAGALLVDHFGTGGPSTLPTGCARPTIRGTRALSALPSPSP
jgi:hypothetical protein